jgi:phenylacetate-CoA ligase
VARDAIRKLMLERAVLPWAAAATPFRAHRHLTEMLEADFETLEAQAARRQERLAELLSHAARETKLYADRLPSSGFADLAGPEAFSALPITRKDDLREGFPRRQLAASYAGRWLRYSNTSGTTGAPLLLIQDLEDINRKYASILRSRVLAGVSPTSSQARITPNECQPTTAEGTAGALSADTGRGRGLFVLLERRLINPHLQRRLMLPPFWGSREHTSSVDFDSYFDRIERFDPEVLTLYPPYALLLADALERSGREPPTLRGVVDFSAALCTPSMRTRIERAFGRPTAQGCGGCEFARYGASCTADPDRMHLAEGHCYVETLRPDGSLCSSGELGNVVVTSLHSSAMPIIRLEPGDVARIFDAPCACGRRSRRIEHHGRIHSMLETGDGRWVTGREVWDRLFAVHGVSLFELRQSGPSDYGLKVVVSPGTELDRTALDAVLADLLGRRATVAVEVVPRLRTEASGKLRLVQSATYERFRVPTERAHPVPVN